MSGLVHFFFNRELPANDTKSDYKTSLLERHTLFQGKHRQLPNSIFNSAPPLTDVTMDYADWKQESKQCILDFLHRRLNVRSDEDDDETDEDDDSSNDNAGKDEDDSMEDDPQLETQAEEWAASKSSGIKERGTETDDAPSKQVNFRRRIPHYQETTHTTQYLADVDLYTKTIQEALCNLQMYWAIRDTNRPEIAIHLQTPRRLPIYKSSPLTRLGRPNCEDDGPLARLYKRVVCIEVIQSGKPVCLLRERAEHIQMTGSQHKATKVFLYNGFAEQMQRLLQKKGLNTSAVIAFHNIPAQCILPWSYSDWSERRDFHARCICVGDQSSMSFKGPNQKVKFRFDAASLRIHVGWDDKGTFLEHIIALDESEKVTVTKLNGTEDGLLKRWRLTTNYRPQTSGPTLSQGQTKSTTQGGSAQTGNYDSLGALEAKIYAHSRVNSSKPCFTNVFASVIGFRPPRKTTVDWMLSVQVVDDSARVDESTPVTPIQLNFFAHEKEDLPNLWKAGDVLRLQRCKVRLFNHEVQLIGRPGETSFVVFRRNPVDESWMTLPMVEDGSEGDNSDSITSQDTDRFIELWKWSQRRLLEHPTMKVEYSFTLDEMKHQGDDAITSKASCDLVAMVTAIIADNMQPLERQGVSPCGFLRIWDGTGHPESDPYPPVANGALNGSSSPDPPVEVLEKIRLIVSRIKELQPESNLCAPDALTGRIANVAIWERSDWELIEEVVSVGSFIRLRNVNDGPLFGTQFRCLMAGDKSYMTPLPDLNYEGVRCLTEHSKRLSRGDPFNMRSGVLPLQPSGLYALMIEPPGTEHNCRVRLAGTKPSLNQIQRNGIKTICFRNAKGKYAYRCAVDVEDDTNKRLSALLTDKAAAALFGTPASRAVKEGPSIIAKLQGNTHNDDRWEGSFHSVVVDGKKYFVVDSLSLASISDE